MQSGTHPDTTVEFVHSLTAWAILGGVRREIEDVTVERECADLPIDSAGGSGIMAGSAEVTWAAIDDDAPEATATAWKRVNQWPPITNQPVEVWAAYDGYTPFKLLTGTIEKSRTDVYSGLITSTCLDLTKRLDEVIDRDAMLRVMPSHEDMTAGFPCSTTSPDARWRQINLTQGTVIDWALRKCGFGGIPLPGPATLLSVPMAGTVWPEVGTLLRAAHPDDQMGALSMFDGPDRTQILSSVNIVWTSAGRGVVFGDVHVYVELPQRAQAIRLEGLGMNAQIGFNGSSAVVCTLRDTGKVLAIPRQTGVNTLQLRVADSGGNLTYTLTHGTESRSEVQAVSATHDTDQLRTTLIGGTASGGIYVEQGTTTPPAVRDTQQATSRFRDKNLVATPAFARRSIRELLADWQQATCNFLFADEHGVIRAAEYRPGTRTTVVPTQIEKLIAETSFGSVRSRVDVTWREVTLEGGGQGRYWGIGTYQGGLPAASLWRGTSLTMQPGDSLDDLIHPGSDEDWVFPYTTAMTAGFSVWAGSSIEYWHWNGPSILGGVQLDRKGAWKWAGGYLSGSFARVDPRTWRVRQAYSPPSGDSRECRTATARSIIDADGYPTLIPAADVDKPIPRLHGWAKITWLEHIAIGAHRGPSTARYKPHDAGWWAQRESDAQAIADRISAHTHKATPSLPDISIVPDLRLQLLDDITIVDADRGINVSGFLLKIHLEVKAGEASMTLGMRITDSTSQAVTLAERDTAYTGRTLTHYDQSHTGQTLAQYDADPLKT